MIRPGTHISSTPETPVPAEPRHPDLHSQKRASGEPGPIHPLPRARPLRRTSREIVDGARPGRCAIVRSDCPVASPMPMASRSSSESYLVLRPTLRSPGPPERSSHLNHFVAQPRPWATSRCASPRRRRQKTSFLSASDSMLRLPSRTMLPPRLSIRIPRCRGHRLRPPGEPQCAVGNRLPTELMSPKVIRCCGLL